MQKILVLTASPIRDKPQDDMIAVELKQMGDEVSVQPCLRKGRDAVLEFQPNTVVTPPVRNPYARDFIETCKRWKMAVVVRHTEPSCDQDDIDYIYNRINEKDESVRQDKRAEESERAKRNLADILGGYPYFPDIELTWGEAEATLLNRRAAGFKVIPVGACTASLYLDPKLKEKVPDRNTFNARYKFDTNKPILLIGSAWGFIDDSPDLQTDDERDAVKDIEGRDKHLEMIKAVKEQCAKKFNILVTIHPNVAVDAYRKILDPLGIPLDSRSPAVELLANADLLIHCASTMAIGMHLQNKPAIQFGRIENCMGADWWLRKGAPVTELSPGFVEIEPLIKALKRINLKKTNANLAAVEKLEKGRYGSFDGKALQRAAGLIHECKGQFTYCWPEPVRDYTQPTVLRSIDQAVQRGHCGICNHDFWGIKGDWLKTNLKDYKPSSERFCPWCGSRFYQE